MLALDRARAGAELWDVALCAMTLRIERDRRARDRGSGIGLAELAASSDEELSERLRPERARMSSRDLRDHRLHAPPLAGDLARPQGDAERSTSPSLSEALRSGRGIRCGGRAAERVRTDRGADLPEHHGRPRAAVREILARIGADPMFAVQDFLKAIHLAGSSTEVELKIYRGGQTRVLRAAIEQRPVEAATR